MHKGVILPNTKKEEHFRLLKLLVRFLWVRCAFVRLLLFHLYFVYIKHVL